MRKFISDKSFNDYLEISDGLMRNLLKVNYKVVRQCPF